MKKIPQSEQMPKWISENLPTELAISTLFRFNVKLQVMEADAESGKTRRKSVEVDILPDLDLNYEILEVQMQEIPAQYAFWAAVYSEVKLAVAVAERKLKARRGEVTNLVSKEYQANGMRTPSADVVKLIVEADLQLNQAELAYQHAQMQAGKLYHMIEALKMKAEMARSLLSLKKQEHS